MATRVLRLPALRQDLQLIEGQCNEEGESGWLIYDPLRHRYFQIMAETFRLLARWQPGLDSRRFLEKLTADQISVDEKRLLSLLEFLRHNQLLQARDQVTRQHLQESGQKNRQGWLTWLIHHYLFIRIPLFRPEGFLRHTEAFAGVFFHPSVVWTIRLLGLIGVLLVLRNWQGFVDTFSYFFNWQGLVFYLIALILIKSAHELGHAYTAHRYGCRVTSIGVAFLVLLPVLYTDTTDAWRLRDHRKRLSIAMAGIRVELHIALLATFLWTFLPEGGAKSAAFFVATTSWLTSLAVNLSPFMRFDGYFMLVDLWKAENLQPRAFALARWQLREGLFGFGEAPPENLSARRHWQFVIYAWATWLYRFFLFLGIALLVYHFAFKLLGVALFLVEILWFIVLPVVREIRVWWSKKSMLKLNRHSLVSLMFLLVFIAGLLIPWQRQIAAPAVMLSSGYTKVYAAEPARVRKRLVNETDIVQQQQLLVQLENPRLVSELEQVERHIELANQQLSLSRASRLDAAQIDVYSRQLSELLSEQQGLKKRLSDLDVRAPVSGRVTGLARLAEGQWVNSEMALLAINPHQQVSVTAYIDEALVHRLKPGAKAHWVGDDGRKTALIVSAIDYTADNELDYRELSSMEGGGIPVRETADGLMKTERAFYKTFLEPEQAMNITSRQRQRGIVHLQADSKSIASSLFERVSAILIRESGF